MPDDTPRPTITLQPAGRSVAAAPGESVLQAALRAGLALESSCRNGSCRACRMRLVAGTIAYRIEWPGLSAEERRDGWMLPCVALPTSDLVIAPLGD